MVNNKTELARISWKEAMEPEEVRRVSDSIASSIIATLTTPTAGSHRLFFIVPTPIPYKKAEEELFSAFDDRKKATGKLRAVSLPQKGKCYVVSGKRCFRMLLPYVFSLGPPELTFIAANCPFDFYAEESVIAKVVVEMLMDEPNADLEYKGFHFDSGDLVESF